jgi:hypothetical protein
MVANREKKRDTYKGEKLLLRNLIIKKINYEKKEKREIVRLENEIVISETVGARVIFLLNNFIIENLIK